MTPAAVRAADIRGLQPVHLAPPQPGEGDQQDPDELGLAAEEPAALGEQQRGVLRGPDLLRGDPGPVLAGLAAPAGAVERSARLEFADASKEDLKSVPGIAAAAAAWLPGPDGEFHRPAELQLDDLPPEFRRDDALAAALGMIQPVVAEASRQLGLPPGLLRGLSAHPDLVAMVERELKARAGPAGQGQQPVPADEADLAEGPLAGWLRPRSSQ